MIDGANGELVRACVREEGGVGEMREGGMRASVEERGSEKRPRVRDRDSGRERMSE